MNYVISACHDSHCVLLELSGVTHCELCPVWVNCSPYYYDLRIKPHQEFFAEFDSPFQSPFKAEAQCLINNLLHNLRGRQHSELVSHFPEMAVPVPFQSTGIVIIFPAESVKAVEISGGFIVAFTVIHRFAEN